MNREILRANFTENIYTLYIKKGKSLNIFGERGVGKSRFAKDLKRLANNDSIHFVYLNMKELRTNYKRLIKRIQKQLNIEGDFKNIELLLSSFSKIDGIKVMIIDNFDSLFEKNHDKKFNFEFFEQLNSFKNKENSSLIVLSLHNYRYAPFYKDNGEETTSPLDIDAKEITPLLQKEIKDELKRRIDIDLGFELLASWIIKERYQYLFIKFIAREIKFGNYNRDDFLERNFERWREQFNKNNSVPLFLKIKKFTDNITIEINMMKIEGIFP